MTRPLTIVMYHYVRDVTTSAYPGIKARSVAQFRNQLRHAKEQYTPVTMEQVMHAAGSRDTLLPARPILLTFDDGYIEHYTTVYPLLREAGIQGSFFPPAKPIVDGQVLDVNKLHFVLARSSDTTGLVNAIFAAVDAHRAALGLENARSYWDRLAVADRFDRAEIVFVKRMLQRELPEELRSELLQRLFREVVSPCERAFARELYMSPEQIREMSRKGMYIGCHGSAHYWMNRLTPPQQEAEIEAGLQFLGSLDCLQGPWAMCYPYGAWNDSLLELLRSRDCAVGLTVEVAVADLDIHNPLTLPRLDTNDLPFNG